MLCRQAIAAEPLSAQAWCLLGRIVCQQRNFDEAIQCCRHALELHADYLDAHYCLGVALRYVGRLDEAAESLQRVIRLAPCFAPAHGALGNVLKAQGKTADAVASFRRALELEPNSADILTNMSLALRGTNVAEALACARRAVQIQPDYAQTHNNLAFVLLKADDAQAAVEHCRTALQLEPNYADAYTNLGTAYHDLGKLDEAFASYERALSLNPNHMGAIANAGLVSADQGKLTEAMLLYNRALATDSSLINARHNRSLLMLLQGDFLRGWPEYEWRWKTEQMPLRQFVQPRWNGEPLPGKTILIWAEQGFGDTIQFVRYASLIKSRGATVVVECQKSLVKLLDGCPGIDQLIAEGDELPRFDFQVPLLSLPAVLKTTLDTIPASVPYISASSRLVTHWHDRLKDIVGFRVGVNWRGRFGPGPWRRRDIPIQQVASLAQIPGIRLISLQKEGQHELAALADSNAIIDLGNDVDTSHGAFMDTAAIMMNLDLIITSDTAAAHLAGALGVPVWLALPSVPDWRWLLDRSDSPWYPTMRLFRQKKAGDWDGVFEEIQAALSAHINSLNAA